LEDDWLDILLTQQQITRGVARLAEEIERYYRQRKLTIVGVMTGSVVLLADLIRLLPGAMRVGLVQARSYRGRHTAPGVLSIRTDLLPDVRGRDVLVVDDIFDTGQTLFELILQLDELGPESIRSLVLLRKQGRARVPIAPDHVGFEIPDRFVVGYGLDYQDAYRNLPYVAALGADELAAGPPP
jgi:hypoxanthine phosphoribosyltransferase